jgi:hypothetical protein
MNQCSGHHFTAVSPIVSMSLLQYIVVPHEHASECIGAGALSLGSCQH